MMTESETIDVADLPEYIRERKTIEVRDDEAFLTLEQVEKAHTVRVLESAGGNKVRAAELLGISRAKLYRLLEETSLSEAAATAPGNLREEPD